MKKVWCFSQYAFDKYMEKNEWNDDNLPENSAFISILSPKDEFGEEHYFKRNHSNVLNIRFEDITDYKLERKGDRTVYGLSNKQAKEIFDFIEKNKGKDFYIHCSAGVSRSQGVTRFIIDYYDNYDKTSLNPNNPCITPNIHVVNLLRHCWLKKYYDGEIEL